MELPGFAPFLKRHGVKAAAIGVGLILFACTPVINQRGYVGDPAVEATIKPGVDSKTTVEDRLGYPSTTATFGGDKYGHDTWYYISATERQVAFFHPTILKRTILAITFDKNNKVAGLRHFSLKDGHVISFESQQTPVRGREMTFLQQLLNATPGAQATPLQQINPGNGGGPIP